MKTPRFYLKVNDVVTKASINNRPKLFHRLGAELNRRQSVISTNNSLVHSDSDELRIPVHAAHKGDRQISTDKSRQLNEQRIGAIKHAHDEQIIYIYIRSANVYTLKCCFIYKHITKLVNELNRRSENYLCVKWSAMLNLQSRNLGSPR